jgi:hypothetical protein
LLSAKRAVNLVPWVTTRYTNRDPIMLGRMSGKLLSRLRMIKEPAVMDPPRGLAMIVTEFSNSTVELHKIFKQLDGDGIRSLTFQILFTLYVMQIHGFQHNDLHAANILVETMPTEVHVDYMLQGMSFRVPMVYGKALLFDWDLASCIECGPNVDVQENYCENIGVCDTLNTRFDMYTFLTLLRPSTFDPEFQTFVDDAVKHPTPEIFIGRMCNQFTSPRGRICLPFPNDQPDYVVPVGWVFDHPYFASLRVA